MNDNTMNSIKEVRKLAAELEKMVQYRAEHPEMFVEGSGCANAYKQIEEELDAAIPKANKLIADWEAFVAKIPEC